MATCTRDLSGGKVDFYLARFPLTVDGIDFVILVNLSRQKVDFFFARNAVH